MITYTDYFANTITWRKYHLYCSAIPPWATAIKLRLKKKKKTYSELMKLLQVFDKNAVSLIAIETYVEFHTSISAYPIVRAKTRTPYSDDASSDVRSSKTRFFRVTKIRGRWFGNEKLSCSARLMTRNTRRALQDLIHWDLHCSIERNSIGRRLLKALQSVLWSLWYEEKLLSNDNYYFFFFFLSLEGKKGNIIFYFSWNNSSQLSLLNISFKYLLNIILCLLYNTRYTRFKKLFFFYYKRNLVFLDINFWIPEHLWRVHMRDFGLFLRRGKKIILVFATQ